MLVFAMLLSASSTFAAEDMPLQGRLVSLQAGDVACYAEMEVAGEVQNLMANFQFCEQEGLVGKPVRLAWADAQVLAADCEGDMDCGRSDTVKIIDMIMVEPANATCAAGEATVFACKIGGKQVAVCFAAGDDASWLQYRFGRAGQKPEMLLPEYPLAAKLSAEGRVETYSGGGASWLRFNRGDHAYVVYTGIGRWGAKGETVKQAGVVVEKRGKQIASLYCDDAPKSKLGAKWYTRVGVRARDDSQFEIPQRAQ